ncbi:MAG: hypothetical protein RR413_12345 [Christensenellaceae bacterium]
MIEYSKDISLPIIENFEVAEYSLDMMDFPQIYNQLSKTIPQRNSLFSFSELETSVACETICAAICHQINWDFLRTTIFRYTIQNPDWILPQNLNVISSKTLSKILSGYDKPERIRAGERAKLLRSLGETILENSKNHKYLEIFMSNDGKMQSKDKLLGILNYSIAFSGDPEGKKVQLLLQNLSDYPQLSGLDTYSKPAIDYHIIRLYLRRGLIRPQNLEAIEYIFSPEKQRTERTVASIRKLCSDVFMLINWLSGIDIKTINSIEWWIGRSVCTKERADCFLEGTKSKWLKPTFEQCPYYKSCHALNSDNKYLSLVEPTYLGSSY